MISGLIAFGGGIAVRLLTAYMQQKTDEKIEERKCASIERMQAFLALSSQSPNHQNLSPAEKYLDSKNNPQHPSTHWVRKIIAIIGVVGLFGAVFYAAKNGIPVSLVTEKEPTSILGLIEWGGGIVVTTINGLVILPEFRENFILIANAYLGAGMTSMGMRK